MEISEVRKRVKQTIERSRRAAAERRASADAASAAYERFLADTAAPLFKQFAAALKPEGFSFQVFTPGGGLRLASDRGSEDYIEVLLDVSGDEPVVMGRVSRGRGSRVLTSEQPLGTGDDIARLSETDVLEFLLQVIQPFVER